MREVRRIRSISEFRSPKPVSRISSRAEVPRALEPRCPFFVPPKAGLRQELLKEIFERPGILTVGLAPGLSLHDKEAVGCVHEKVTLPTAAGATVIEGGSGCHDDHLRRSLITAGVRRHESETSFSLQKGKAFLQCHCKSDPLKDAYSAKREEPS